MGKSCKKNVIEGFIVEFDLKTNKIKRALNVDECP